MSLQSAFDRLAFLVSVPRCVSCDEKLDYTDLALCQKCSAVFEEIKTRNCSECAKVLSECSCVGEYLERHFVKVQIKVFRYKNRDENIAANSLIYSLKQDNRKDVLKRCTLELARAISNSIDDPENYVFTNVPRRKSQIVKYGIDHAKLLARSLADHYGAEYIQLLKSNVKTAQKTLVGKDRATNVDFDIANEVNLAGRGVIIVDDIVTTGASVAASAMLIRTLGTKKIVAASLAIATRDEHSYI